MKKWDTVEKKLEESEVSRDNPGKQTNGNQAVGIGFDHMSILKIKKQ